MGNGILALMSLFVCKHFLADFPLQSQSMVDNKGKYGNLYGIAHSGIHGILTAAAVAVYLLGFDPETVSVAIVSLCCGLLDFVLHYHIDWAKQNLSKGMTGKDRCFWIVFGIDQLLHYLTYILIIGLLL